MNTISSKNSLILAKQTLNRSNIFDIDELFFKDNYHNVFAGIAALFSSGKKFGTFTDIWHKFCTEECAAVKQKVSDHVKKHIEGGKLSDEDEELIKRVVVKFRGNLGEIFAEAFFREGYMANLCKVSTYNTVDPTNDEYVDAESISASDGLPVGIQIKNYNKYAEKSVDAREIFNKACVSYLRGLHTLKTDVDKLLYISQPHQIIFSFTELGSELIVDGYNKEIIFFGPKEINSKYLQGNVKKNISANWLFFKTIADEIQAFTK